MTHKLQTERKLAGRVAQLATKLKDYYDLDEMPQLAFDETAGTLEVPDLPEIASVVERIDLETPTEAWRKRAVELLDKDKLTPKEDEELKHLHRRMFRETLRNGLD